MTIVCSRVPEQLLCEAQPWSSSHMQQPRDGQRKTTPHPELISGHALDPACGSRADPVCGSSCGSTDQPWALHPWYSVLYNEALFLAKSLVESQHSVLLSTNTTQYSELNTTILLPSDSWPTEIRDWPITTISCRNWGDKDPLLLEIKDYFF